MDNMNVFDKQFIKKHWDELIGLDIPLFLLEDVNKWSYFIEHFDYPGLSFSLAQLNKQALIQFCKLISLYDNTDISVISFKQHIQKLIKSK